MDTSNSLLGVPIGTRTLAELEELSLQAIEHGGSQLVFACANPHSLVVARGDEAFLQSLQSADIVVADGVGVTMMARAANRSVGPRITGEDYFLATMRALNARHGRVYFFGSSEHVLQAISQRIERDFPSITVCGTLSPPFRAWSDAENSAMIEQINHTKPDVLWVGMTAPKQEKWVEKNKHDLHASLIGSIGAVFDFYAGTYPRAPEWMCRIGLEWLYRLIKEPKRMWKRNFISNPKFVLLVLWKHILKPASN